MLTKQHEHQHEQELETATAALATDCIIGVKRDDSYPLKSWQWQEKVGKTQKMSAGRESASMIEKRIFCFLNKIFQT